MPQNASTLILVALMVAAFYFLILRPQKKRQQAMQQTMNSLTPGTRVLLGSGIFGTIISIGARQAVIEVAPGSEVTVLKQAIARIATDADEDTFDDDDEEELLDEPDLVADPAVDATYPRDPAADATYSRDPAADTRYPQDSALDPSYTRESAAAESDRDRKSS